MLSAFFVVMLGLLFTASVIVGGIHVLYYLAIFVASLLENQGLKEPARCTNCKARLRPFQNVCENCGHNKKRDWRFAIRRDLSGTVRTITRWRSSGKVDDALYETLVKLVEASEFAHLPYGTREDRVAALQESAMDGLPAAPPVKVADEPPKPPPIPTEQIADSEDEVDCWVADEVPVDQAPQLPPASMPKVLPTEDTSDKNEAEPLPKQQPDFRSEVDKLVRSMDRFAAPKESSPRLAAITPKSIAPVSDPAKRARPKLTFANLLSSFMDERNIRWGELISGALIVMSSIGLVISLWTTLQDAIPYLPALVFMAVTLAIHAAGSYTLRHWKLDLVSRTLLLIGELLIPLNFLALIALYERSATDDTSYRISIGVGILVCGFMSWSAGKYLLSGAPWILTIAVLGISASQLPLGRISGPDLNPTQLLQLALLPLGCHILAGSLMFWREKRNADFNAENAPPIFRLLAVSSFTLLLTLGLEVYKTKRILWALHWLSPLAGLATLPLMALGLLLHQRMQKQEQATIRTAGTAIFVLAVAIMLGMIGLAWPRTELMIGLCLYNFLAITILAWLFDMAILQSAAIGSISFAAVLGFHLLRGSFAGIEDYVLLEQRLYQCLAGSETAAFLLPLGFLFSALSACLRRFRRHAEAQAYRHGASGIFCLSFGIAIYSGFLAANDSLVLVSVFAIHAVRLLAISLAVNRKFVTIAASIVLATASIYIGWMSDWLATEFHFLQQSSTRRFFVCLLLHAGIMVVLAISRKFIPRSAAPVARKRNFVLPAALSGMFSSFLCLLLLIVSERRDLPFLGTMTEVLALIWLLAAIALETKLLTTAAQVASLAGLLPIVTYSCIARGTVSLADIRWIPTNAAFLQSQMMALGAWCLVCLTIGEFYRRWQAKLLFIPTPIWSIDKFAVGFLAALALALPWLGCLPSIAQELVTANGAIGAVAIGPVAVGMLIYFLVGVVLMGEHFQFGQPSIRKFTPAIIGGIVALIVMICVLVDSTMHFGASDFFDWHLYAKQQHWVVVALTLSIGVLTAWVDRKADGRSVTVAGIAALIPMLAIRAAPINAVATEARWLWVTFFALISLAQLWRRRAMQKSIAGNAHGAESIGVVASTQRFPLTPFLVFLCVIPLALVTSIGFLLAMFAGALGGPNTFDLQPWSTGNIGSNLTRIVHSGSLFGWMEIGWSYAGPIIVLALILTLQSIRFRQQYRGALAGFAANIAAILAFVVPKFLSHRALASSDFCELLILLSVVNIGLALVWSIVRRRNLSLIDETGEAGVLAPEFTNLLHSQYGLGLSAYVFAMSASLLRLSMGAALTFADWATVSGRPIAWIAFALLSFNSLLLQGKRRFANSWQLSLLAFFAAPQLAFAFLWGNGSIDVFCRTLLIGWPVTAIALLALQAVIFKGIAQLPSMRYIATMVVSACVGTILLAYWRCDLPSLSTWSFWGVLISASSLTWLAVLARRDLFVLFAAVPICFTFALGYWLANGIVPMSQISMPLTYTNLIAMALTSILATRLEPWTTFGRENQDFSFIPSSIILSRAAQVLLTVILSITAIFIILTLQSVTGSSSILIVGHWSGFLCVTLIYLSLLFAYRRVWMEHCLNDARNFLIAISILMAAASLQWEASVPNLSVKLMMSAWVGIGLLMCLGLWTIAILAHRMLFSMRDAPDGVLNPGISRESVWLRSVRDYMERMRQKSGAGSIGPQTTFSAVPEFFGVIPWEKYGLAVVQKLQQQCWRSLLLLSTLIVLGGTLVLFAREIPPAWPTAWVGICGLMFASIAVLERKASLALVSTFILAFAATMPEMSSFAGYSVDFVMTPVLAFIAVGFGWLGVDMYWRQKFGQPFNSTGTRTIPVNLIAAYIAAFLLLVVASWWGMESFLSISTTNFGHQDVKVREVSPLCTPKSLGTLLWLAVMLVFSGIQSRRKEAYQLLYSVSLLAVFFSASVYVSSFALMLSWLQTYLAITVFLAGVAWWMAEAASHQSEEAETEVSTASLLSGWLCNVQMLAALLTVGLGCWFALQSNTVDGQLRAAASAIVATAGLILTLRRLAQTELQLFAEMLAAFSASLLGLCAFAPDSQNVLLHRIVWMSTILSFSAAFFSFVHNKLALHFANWSKALRAGVLAVSVMALVAMLGLLLQEFHQFPATATKDKGVPLSVAEALVSAFGIMMIAVAAIRSAVLTGADPLGLSEKGKMWYVYAAEIILALLFVHTKFTFPALFPGLWERYWPIILLAISFAGAGLSDLFRRTGHPVLAEPLERTGAFLPLLPAAAIWYFTSQVDNANVMFGIAVLYAVLAMSRKSFLFSVAAGLAGNAGLWMVLQKFSTSVFQHPQMWFVPPALSVLVAAQINRDRLAKAQLTAIRYVCILVIYVSSTSDILIAGMNEEKNWWMPIVLGGLSIAGVMFGIMLRVRAYLYLGTSFLFVSLISIVWNAQQKIGQVWPWFAFGIVAGIAILTLFAFVEKKRKENQNVLAELRNWEA